MTYLKFSGHLAKCFQWCKAQHCNCLGHCALFSNANVTLNTPCIAGKKRLHIYKRQAKLTSKVKILNISKSTRRQNL